MELKYILMRKFFTTNNLDDDIKDLKYYTDKFYQIFLETAYLVKEFQDIYFPTFYVSQIHLS